MIAHKRYCDGGHSEHVTCSKATALRKEARHVALKLTQYERDNLLALVAAICLHSDSPLRVANTGDWAAQVLDKLGYVGEYTNWGRPNVSAEQLAENARQHHPDH